MSQRTAVILLNLGGPSSLDEVDKFLRSMFSDRHIISAPLIARSLLGLMVSKIRARSSRKIYELMGGRSVILEKTSEQAAALERRLNLDPVSNVQYRVFVCMRHSKPRAREALSQVLNFQPQRVVLLPMYPHYSFATTQSAIEDWYSNSYRTGHKFDTDIVWCYPEHDDYIAAHCELILHEYRKAIVVSKNTRILFSAHGLPMSHIEKGDPYQQQLEQTVNLIVKKLNISSLDYSLCYQSRVGPARWLEPTTKSELMLADSEDRSVVVVPISFVCENSETLVELDMEYLKLMKRQKFFRVPALGTHKLFIECLYDLVMKRRLH